jgi:hypothetical protein
MDEYGDFGYGTTQDYGQQAYGYGQPTYGEPTYGYDTSYGYGAGYDANPMGLPSVDEINAYAGAQYDQTTAALDAETAQMEQQYEQYGQTIESMNADGRYDGVLAAADAHDSQMAYSYQQYGNAVGAQTNAQSWEQADAQAAGVRSNL